MRKIKLVVETDEEALEFEIDEFGGKFYVFAVTSNVLGSKQTKRSARR